MPQQPQAAAGRTTSARPVRDSRRGRRDARRQPAVAVEPAFQFEQHGGASADQIAEFAERHHALGAAAEGNALELGGGQAIEPAGALGEAAEHVVVMHHGLAVGADLQIDLDAVAAVDRRAHGARRCSR